MGVDWMLLRLSVVFINVLQLNRYDGARSDQAAVSRTSVFVVPMTF